MSSEESGTQDYVTVTIADQLFGIPVLSVQDVLGTQNITRIPLAPAEVAGALNLRGRIVTAIDVRCRLNLPPQENDPGAARMSVVVEQDNEPYSLLIDAVGEVLSLPAERYERTPATLDSRWREVASGIFRLENELLVVLDVEKLLDFSIRQAA